MFETMTLIAAVAMSFPEISPALVSIDLSFIGLPTFHLRWYALGYIGGIVGAWWYATQLVKRPALFGGQAPATKENIDDIIFWTTVGIIVGGRLGYVLFYMVPFQFEQIAANPLVIFKVWDGGMAFHGGMAGVAIALWWSQRGKDINLLSIGDIAGIVAPIGIFLVRCANFINAELFGKPTTSSFGMVFPEGYAGGTPPAYDWATKTWVYCRDHNPAYYMCDAEVARYPSQLYEAFLEGLLPLMLLSLLAWKFGALKRKGLIAGLFLLMYGFGRSFVEQFRMPDSFVEGLPEWLSMGQLLSIPMWVGGAFLVWNALRKPAETA